MKYMGSKSKIAKDIVPIIQQIIGDNNIKVYLEPFCGGCNVIDKIKCEIKIASDKQFYLIELFKNLDRLNKLPKDFVERSLYNDVRTAYNKRDNSKYEPWFVGAIGFLASYNGRFFDGGYSGLAKSGYIARNYYDECKRNLETQAKFLKDVKFCCADYSEWSNIEKALIYCDPPYNGTKLYNVSRNFDYDKFWQWCRNMSDKNIVLISEETAPDDFEIIWQKEVKRTINTSKKFNKTEKLFKWIKK